MLILAFSFPKPTLAQSYVAGKLTVILKDNATQGMVRQSNGVALLPNATALNALNTQNGLVAMRPMSKKANSAFKNFYTFEFASTADLNALTMAYQASPNVQWVSKIPNDPPKLLGSQYFPADPIFPKIWHLYQTATNSASPVARVADGNFPAAWQWTKGDSNVVIAICGGGIPISQQTVWPYYWWEASRDVINNIWNNPNEIANNGIDDDGNGYVDDIHGWNFYNDNNDIEGRYDINDPSQGALAINHGYYCASYAAAADDTTIYDLIGKRDWSADTVGWVGAAPKCKIMGIAGYPIGESITYAYENGATVFSMSWTFDTSYFKPFIDTAFAHGMVFVNAYGNASTQTFNVAPNGVSVAMLNPFNQKSVSAVGSQSGPDCSISTGVTGEGGTSFAAPIVAGVVALMKSINPHLTPQQLRAMLVDPSAVNPVNGTGLGVGRVDAYKAIKNASGSPTLTSLTPDAASHPVVKWTPNLNFSLPQPTQYVIQKYNINQSLDFQNIATVDGNTTTYTDGTETIIQNGNNIYTTHPISYRVVSRYVWASGLPQITLSVPSNEIQVTVKGSNIAPEGRLVNTTEVYTDKLVGNYPNPFNPTTQISFELAQDRLVTLTIYDVLGREVAKLLNGNLQKAGRNTVAFNAGKLSSGVYFYRLQAGDFVATKKLLLAK
jgi:hypothetical protein